MNSSFSSFVKGVLVGLGVGFLVAPKSGRETRETLHLLEPAYLSLPSILCRN